MLIRFQHARSWPMTVKTKPMTIKTKTLFSVIEVIDNRGEKSVQVDWHPELYSVLDAISPNGEITDRIIDIAEELHVENG